MDFFQKLAHEMIHAQSFHSVEKARFRGKAFTIPFTDGEAIDLEERRMGFQIRSKEGVKLFTDINEAITTELQVLFAQEYLGFIPEIHDEYEILEHAQADYSKEHGLDLDEIKRVISALRREKPDGGYVDADFVMYPYSNQRKDLLALIQELYEKNKDQYNDRIEVVKLFAKAYFTGELLPVARLIEKTYGEGSFRELGKKTAAKPKESENKAE